LRPGWRVDRSQAKIGEAGKAALLLREGKNDGLCVDLAAAAQLAEQINRDRRVRNGRRGRLHLRPDFRRRRNDLEHADRGDRRRLGSRGCRGIDDGRAYLDVETTRDALAAKKSLARSDLTLQTGAIAASLPGRLAAAGLTQEQSTALAGAVQRDPAALCGLFLALQGRPEAPLNPWEQALWMLLADFMAAAVPILPFVWLPIPQARVVSGAVTLLLLIGLGIGRARIAKRDMWRTVIETVSIGIAAALAGVVIGVLVDRAFTG
jgi:VIT1/CCC1 family predicted Fe2+/Mn2+ transporter